MFKKTTFAAAAIATAIAAAPVSTASATSFYFGFGGPGYGFGVGPGPGPYPYPSPSAYSCWQAKNTLQASFAQVWKVECGGSTYTFKVKNWGPWKTIKFNKYNGNYWFV